jgi:hypothetical protein
MIDDALNQQYPYPGLTADPEEWMFQSADTVFFDNLMRSSGMGSVSDSGSSWTNCRDAGLNSGKLKVPLT